MRALILALIAVSLSGCATRLTLISPPLPAELLARCPDKVADPLTTGDQFDLSRALVESLAYAKNCKARHDALADAVEIRQSIMDQIQERLGSNK